MADRIFSCEYFTILLLLVSWGAITTAKAGYSSSIDHLALKYTDDTFQDLADRYETSDHYNFWHPNTYKSEIHSREVVTIGSTVTRSIAGEFQQWKSVRLGHKTIFVALAANGIHLFNEKLKPLETISTTASLVTLTTFAQWNDHSGKSELIIIVASRKPSLLVFSYSDGKGTYLGTWPIPHAVQALELCVVELTRKIIVVPENRRASIDVYNFESHNSSSQVWFFQRLKLDNRTCVAVQELDSGCRVAYTTTNNDLNVWSYEPHSKMFQQQSNFYNVTSPCKQLVPFSLAYSNYLALVPQGNRSVEFYGANGKESLNQRTPLMATEISAAPVNDFKGEDVLIVNTPAEETKIYAFDGIARAFKEGYHCEKERCTLLQLSSGTSTVVNGTTLFIAPPYKLSNFSAVLVIDTHTEDHVSPLFERFRTFYNSFRILADLYKRFQLAVMEVSTALDDAVVPSEPNVITGNWTVNEVRSASTAVISKTASKFPIGTTVGTVEFMGTALHPQDFDITNQQIKDELNDLQKLLDSGYHDLSQTVPRNSSDAIEVTAPQIIQANIRTTHIQSRRATLNIINEVLHIERLFNDLVPRNLNSGTILNIGGEMKFLGQLTSKNLQALTINGVPTKAFALKSKPNAFRSPVVFLNNFVAGTVTATRVSGLLVPQEVLLATNLQGMTLQNGITALNEAAFADSVAGVVVDKELENSIFMRDSDQKIVSRIKFEQVVIRQGGRILRLNENDFSKLMGSIVLRNHSGTIYGVKTAGNVTAETLTIRETLNGIGFPHGFIRKNKTVVNMYGAKDFSYLEVHNLTLGGTINDRNPSDMIPLYSPGQPHGTCNWTMYGAVVFKGDTRIQETMGGANVSDFRFRDTFNDQKSRYYPNHNIRFESPVIIENLRVRRHVNGKIYQETFGEALICQNGRPLIINGTTTFKHGATFGNLTVKSGQVNDKRLKDFFNRNVEQNITSNAIFTSSVHFKELVALSNIDKADLVNAVRDAILVTENQSWPPQLRFDSISALQGIAVTGSINQISNFSDAIAVKVGRSQQIFKSHIQATQLQANIVRAESITTSDTINGISIQEWLQRRISLSEIRNFSQPVEIRGKAIMAQNLETRSLNGESTEFIWSNVLRSNRKSQTFSSPVVVYGTMLTEASTLVRKKLNGYNLKDIMRDSVPVNGSAERISTRWSMQNAIFKNLTVVGKTCGVDLQQLALDSIGAAAQDVAFQSAISFHGNVTVQHEGFIKTLNNLNITSDFFSLNQDQNISNSLVFQSDVKIQNGFTVDGRINNISLAELGSNYSFTNSTHHLRLPNVRFDSTFKTAHLHVRGLIQQRSLEGFLNSTVKLKAKEQQYVRGNLQFLSPIISEGNVQVQSLNGVHISSLANKLVKVGENVVFTQLVCFHGGLETTLFSVQNNASVATESDNINGVSMAEMLRESIQVSSKSPVNLHKLSLRDAELLGQVKGVKYINAIPFEKLLTRTTPQSIQHLKVSRLWINQSEITVSGLFGGVDLVETFVNTFSSTGKNGRVTGEKTFTGKATIRGNLFASRSILDQLVYLQTGESPKINSAISFVNDLYVTEDMTLDGTWNGYSLQDLEKRRVSTTGNNIISGNWNFAGGLVMKKSAVSYGLIGGLNVSHVERKSRANVFKYAEGMASEQDKYVKICRYFKMLYNESTRSPLHLQSVDEHQTIVMQNRIKSMLTVQVNDMPYVLVASDSCVVRLYKWSSEEELLYEDKEVSLPGSTMKKWEGFLVENQGIIVFSSSFSMDCPQSLVTGLHLVILSETGNLSAPQVVVTGNIIDFNTVSTPSKTLLFLITEENPNVLTVKAWNSSKKKFETEAIMNVTSVLSLHAAVIDDISIKILLQADTHINVTTYQVLQKRFDTPRRTSLCGSAGKVQFFRADSHLYAVSPLAEAEGTRIKPTNTLQLYRITSSGEELIQKLETYDLVSMEIALLGNQVYILALTKPAGLYVYKFMGLSGLRQTSPYPLKFHDGESLSVFHVLTWNYDTPFPFALISRRNVIKLIHSNVVGNAVNDRSLASKVSHLC